MGDMEAIKANQALLEKVLTAIGHQKKHGGRWVCRWHDNNNLPSLTIFLSVGVWRYRCWVCGASGTVVDAVAKKQDISVGDAAQCLMRL